MMEKSQFFFFFFRKPCNFTWETHCKTWETHCKTISFKAKVAEMGMCQDIYHTVFTNIT